MADDNSNIEIKGPNNNNVGSNGISPQYGKNQSANEAAAATARNNANRGPSPSAMTSQRYQKEATGGGATAAKNNSNRGPSPSAMTSERYQKEATEGSATAARNNANKSSTSTPKTQIEYQDPDYGKNQSANEAAAATTRNNSNKSTISVPKTQIEYQDPDYGKNQSANEEAAAAARKSAISTPKNQIEYQNPEYGKNQSANAFAGAQYYQRENGISYWLGDINNIEEEIKVCKGKLEDVIKDLMAMQNLVKRYVNPEDGKGWGDENSDIFAKWWNKGCVGTLKYVVNSSGGYSITIDESDNQIGMKRVINECAKLYWMVICSQLYIVTKGKFMQKSKNFDIHTSHLYHLGSDTKYINVDINEHTEWMNLLSEVMYKEYEFSWKGDVLDTHAKGGKKIEELNLFVSAYITLIKNFEEHFVAYTESIRVFLNDSSMNLFGIKPNDKVSEAAETLIKNTKTTISDMVGFTVDVVDKFNNKVSNNITDYINKFNNISGGAM